MFPRPVVLGNLGGQDVTLTMAYKSTAAMNAGYLDATGTSPSINSLFPDSMAQSSISGKCNGVKGADRRPAIHVERPGGQYHLLSVRSGQQRFLNQ